MADAMKLLPCPFCGGEAALLDYEARYGGLHYASRCPQCASCGCSMGYLPTAKKAVEAWNCRAPMPAPEKAPSFDDARRKLIHCIEQWDGETEYDAEDIAALADDILDVFASPPAREEAPAERTYTDEEILRDTVPADLLEAEIRRLQEFAYDAQDMNLEIAASNNYPDAPGALASDLLAVLNERACKRSPSQSREVPAEGAGEGDWLNGTREVPVGTPEWCARAEREILALRDRTSEPEAGEAWKDHRLSRIERVKMHRVAFGSDLKTAINAVDEHAAVSNILAKIPAPATADKLRVAVEALEPFAAFARVVEAKSRMALGEVLSDDKILASISWEGGLGVITVGHLRDALTLAPNAKGWGGVYRRPKELAALNEQPQ